MNKLEFFYCPTNGPHYQVASIKPQHIYKHFGDCELIKLLIDVKHLETFINEITTDEIELLSLDIEGLDAEVILDIDFTKIKIKHLSFEYVHLGNREQEVRTYLIDNNLKYLGSGVDHGGNDYLYIKNTP